MPGGDLERVAALAETLRASIAAEPHWGQAVTMSFGVAVQDGDEPFRYAAVFAQADSHLYSAKRAGRDRVLRPRGALSSRPS